MCIQANVTKKFIHFVSQEWGERYVYIYVVFYIDALDSFFLSYNKTRHGDRLPKGVFESPQWDLGIMDNYHEQQDRSYPRP